MTSLLEGARPRPGDEPQRGTGTGDRVEALVAAVDLARERVDPDAVEQAESTAHRAAGRMRLSADHTVVAIAGATGSGKSSTFNALTGLELAATGVRRPTTSWAAACVWGSRDASEVLDWLGIPPRHQTSRGSMLDGSRHEGADLDGVVLLDLPDHDSTEVSHHLEVDRLVEKADLMVWVLDPQKYADNAVHDRYLRPLAAHADQIVVVLNHLDAVPEARRDAMLADVRRLLVADGLAEVPLIGVSAREGWGVDELRSEIGRRVSDKALARGRVDVDVRAAADRLAEAAGAGSGAPPRELGDDRVAAFTDALADAAGVPVVTRAVGGSVRRRARRATAWPLLAWLPALRKDPVAASGLELGEESGRQLGGRSYLPRVAPVERPRFDAATRDLADEHSAGLPPAWADAVRRVTTERSGDLAERVDGALGSSDLGVARLPLWVRLVQVLQWVLLLVAVGGAVWFGLVAAGVAPGYALGPVDLPLLLLAVGLVGGLLLTVVAWSSVGRTARFRADVADRMMRHTVSEAAGDLVVTPLRSELAAHAQLSAAIARARG
ncbi:GTPase [uncultured Nocardioides sp.]|uniref:GTPase n=1 Tax=uncultured Nocardioides sp. TaxID=198441 RepID=UPI0026375CCD|nr:GTPase [uncultured Nocardioides sp.]